MRVLGHDGLWACGDCAAVAHPRYGKIAFPHWDWARRTGIQAAESVLGTAQPFDAEPFWFSNIGPLAPAGARVRRPGRGVGGDRRRPRRAERRGSGRRRSRPQRGEAPRRACDPGRAGRRERVVTPSIPAFDGRLPVDIRFGEGVVAELAAVARAEGARRAYVILDPVAGDLPGVADALAALSQERVEVTTTRQGAGRADSQGRPIPSARPSPRQKPTSCRDRRRLGDRSRQGRAPGAERPGAVPDRCRGPRPRRLFAGGAARRDSDDRRVGLGGLRGHRDRRREDSHEDGDRRAVHPGAVRPRRPGPHVRGAGERDFLGRHRRPRPGDRVAA